MKKVKHDYQSELEQLCYFAASKYPALGIIGTYIGRQVISKEEMPFIAMADTVNVYFREDFFDEFSFNEQVFVLLHEYMHIAMCHGYRMKTLYETVGNFNERCYRIAVDLVVNESLDQLINTHPGAEIPANCLRKNQFLPETPIHVFLSWNMEKVYSELLKQAAPDNEECEYTLSGDIGGDGFPESSVLAEQNDATEKAQGAKYADADMESRVWSERLQDVIGEVARSTSPSLSNTLRVDAASISGRLDWKQVIRTTVRKMMPTIEDVRTYKKPHRNTLTGLYGWYAPGKVRKDGPPLLRIDVFIDTSGSCFDQNSLSMYLGFLSKLSRDTNLFLHEFDTRVKGTQQISKGTPLRNIELRGGGGTCYMDCFRLAEEEGTDLAIFLTDLECTSWPSEIPKNLYVLWASENIKYKEAIPYGKFVHLKA